MEGQMRARFQPPQFRKNAWLDRPEQYLSVDGHDRTQGQVFSIREGLRQEAIDSFVIERGQTPDLNVPEEEERFRKLFREAMERHDWQYLADPTLQFDSPDVSTLPVIPPPGAPTHPQRPEAQPANRG
jgi:hypothetical protein